MSKCEDLSRWLLLARLLLLSFKKHHVWGWNLNKCLCRQEHNRTKEKKKGRQSCSSSDWHLQRSSCSSWLHNDYPACISKHHDSSFFRVTLTAFFTQNTLISQHLLPLVRGQYVFIHVEEFICEWPQTSPPYFQEDKSCFVGEFSDLLNQEDHQRKLDLDRVRTKSGPAMATVSSFSKRANQMPRFKLLYWHVEIKNWKNNFISSLHFKAPRILKLNTCMNGQLTVPT